MREWARNESLCSWQSTTRSCSGDSSPETSVGSNGRRPTSRRTIRCHSGTIDKVVAETAILLLLASRTAATGSPLRASIDRIAGALSPLARATRTRVILAWIRGSTTSCHGASSTTCRIRSTWTGGRRLRLDHAVSPGIAFRRATRILESQRLESGAIGTYAVDAVNARLPAARTLTKGMTRVLENALRYLSHEDHRWTRQTHHALR